jgi:uncharacterized protein YjiS (DUF1127 family)
MKTLLENQLSWLAACLGRVAAAWRREREAILTRRLLGAMREGELRDLGIDRSELSSIASHPRDATRARAKWSC